MKSKFLFLLAIVFFFLSDSYATEPRYNLPIENSPYVGSENAPVTIIEFIDYQ